MIQGTTRIEPILNRGGFVNRSFRIRTEAAEYCLKLRSDNEARGGLRQWKSLHTLLEGRYHAPRMVTEGGSVYLLDWEGLAPGDPVMDWAMLCGPCRGSGRPRSGLLRWSIVSRLANERLVIWARATSLEGPRPDPTDGITFKGRRPIAAPLQIGPFTGEARNRSMVAQPDRPTCLACGRDEHETPLVQLAHRGSRTWICPQHLPVLIHHPENLVGRLPGAESLRPAETHDQAERPGGA